jgi:hypothetical protein
LRDWTFREAVISAFECTTEKMKHCLTLRYRGWYVVITPQHTPPKKARFQSFGQELVREYFQLPESICPDLEWFE